MIQAHFVFQRKYVKMVNKFTFKFKRLQTKFYKVTFIASDLMTWSPVCLNLTFLKTLGCQQDFNTYTYVTSSMQLFKGKNVCVMRNAIYCLHHNCYRAFICNLQIAISKIFTFLNMDFSFFALERNPDFKLIRQCLFRFP